LFEELLHARHSAQLEILEEYLEDAGYLTQLLARSETFPMNVLLAALKPDRNERERLLHISFIPIAEDELEHIQLLQLYTTVNVEEGADTRSADVLALLNAVNCRLAIGQFAVKDDGEIHYRYVHCPSVGTAEPNTPGPFLEIVTLFVFMLDMFAALIAEIAEGRLTLNQALAALA
jgi:hypothetical protein